MSLDEQERRRRPYEREDDYRVMRFKTWCDSKGISVPTGRRLVRSGKGPRICSIERTDNRGHRQGRPRMDGSTHSRRALDRRRRHLDRPRPSPCGRRHAEDSSHRQLTT